MRFPLYLLAFIFFTHHSSALDKIERKNWEGKVQLKNIIINNQFGDVRIRYGGDGDIVEYLAVIQQIDKPLTIEIDKNKDSDTFSITSKIISEAQKNSIPNEKSRVDMTVYIPKGKMLTVLTKDGLIEAKGLKSNINLETVTGAISVKGIDGSVNTKNDSGETVLILSNKHIKEQSFSSIYGNISVLLSEDSNFNIDVSTSADIISDFSTEIKQHRHSEPNKTATIKINKAHSKLTFFSKRGIIAIRELRKY